MALIFNGWHRSVSVLAAALVILYVLELMQQPGGGVPGAAARYAWVAGRRVGTSVYATGMRVGVTVGTFLGCVLPSRTGSQRLLPHNGGAGPLTADDPFGTRESLALMTGRRAFLTIRGLIMLCHLLFAYAQFSGFWQTDERQDLGGGGLFSVKLEAKIEVRYFPLVCAVVRHAVAPAPPSARAAPCRRDREHLLRCQIALGGLLWNVVQSNRPADCPRLACDPNRNYNEYVANMTSDNPACMVIDCGEAHIERTLFEYSYLYSVCGSPPAPDG